MTTRTSLVALAALAALATTALSSNSASAAGHFAQGFNKGSGFGGAPNRTPSMPTQTAGTASANGQTGFQHKLASNGTQLNTTHALADPCSGLGAPKTCFLNQGKGVGGTGGSAAALGPKTPSGSGTTADPCSGVGAPKTCFLNQGKGVDGTGGSATALGATAPAIPSGNKGSGGNTGANDTTGNGTTPTGGGTGSGGNTNANNGNGNGGNDPHPGLGGRPFPGRLPVVFGHGPLVDGPIAAGVAVGGPIAPVARRRHASLAAPNCLTKDYLQTGVVMFRDLCSHEWAINNSSITKPAPAGSACLSKENPQDGVVLFKDNCTSEWAINPQPADNQPHAN